jgi:predicted SAM-dependent methyltransferase
VLEHIPDDRLAMRELFRVLSPGGWAILQVPFSQVLDTTYENPAVITPGDRETTFGHWDHVRIYGLDYPARLEGAGFEVEAFSWVRDPDPVFHQPKINLNPKELVFFCRRS